MLDKSIDGALLALRKQIIRGDGMGLEHVEALLAQRGVPMPRVLPAKRPDAARRGMMRRLLIDALRGRSRTLAELASYVTERRPEIPARAAYLRTTQALDKLRLAGLVRREGRAWSLVTSPAASNPSKPG